MVYDRSIACARDACCTFSEIAKYPSQVRAGVIVFVLKSEHIWLETVRLLVTARAHAVRHIALFHLAM